jgi:hypothetical protein
MAEAAPKQVVAAAEAAQKRMGKEKSFEAEAAHEGDYKDAVVGEKGFK